MFFYRSFMPYAGGILKRTRRGRRGKRTFLNGEKPTKQGATNRKRLNLPRNNYHSEFFAGFRRGFISFPPRASHGTFSAFSPSRLWLLRRHGQYRCAYTV